MTNNPVSNAAILKPLPLPELEDTLGRLRHVVSAVASNDQLAHTDEAIADFKQQEGPRLQAQLREFAEEKEAENSSWLAEQWLDDYLDVRTSLPVTTNVGFQARIDVAGEGLDRVARVIRRIAEVHLMQARGQMPEERDFRDNPLSSTQWRCFNGGLRHPNVDRDEILRCTKGARSRRIGVLHEGRMWNVPISDGSGHALSISTIRAALGKIVDAPAPEAEEGSDAALAARPGFADMSYLGSGLLAEPFNEMVRDRDNAETYDQLRDQLFHVSLDSTRGSEEELLRRAAFSTGLVWVYKPITYVISTVQNFQAMHVEHSTVDGATLVTALRRIQEVKVKDEAPGSPALARPEELTWARVPEELASVGTPGGASVGAEPELRIVDAPRLPQDEIPFKFSADAMSQLILTLAQELTFGRTRGVYEAVDMRDYKAGRTECLRAATPEAVAFAKDLIKAEDAESAAEDAELREKLDAVLAAHRAWVKSCKAGAGIDRHLWALNFTARKSEEGTDGITLLKDEGVALALRDFLSTTSVGSADQLIRYAFAPTVAEGFGVTYTPNQDHIEYLVSYSESAEDPQWFLENLVTAGQLLVDYLAALKK